MEFDAERKGTGTKEWAEVTENICRGCANNCLYCYAAHNSNRFKQRDRADWSHEVLTKRANITSYPARGGVVMFPSSHDITPFNLEAYIRVALVILRKGNQLLVVTKPRLRCVEALLDDLGPFKKQILFRFTVGSMNDATCAFWEPGAPEPQERVACLEQAFDQGFKTSVSIEPMLAGVEQTLEVCDYVHEMVTDTIWIGKMNKARLRVAPEHAAAVANIERLQRDAEILRLYHELENAPKIRWKDSIKEVVSRYTS